MARDDDVANLKSKRRTAPWFVKPSSILESLWIAVSRSPQPEEELRRSDGKAVRDPVSRCHARLYLAADGAIYIEDLKSTQGTSCLWLGTAARLAPSPC